MNASTEYRVALYARISTSNGHQSPEMQLRELREFCVRRGWQVANEYVDRVSGSKAVGRRAHMPVSRCRYA
jgi:DNA invertase Pin-like site-specific DNA recombinase